MWLNALLQAIRYLMSVIPPTVLGVVLMELLIELGLIQRLGLVTAPFMRFGHLRQEIGLSFLVSSGSPTAGNALSASWIPLRRIISMMTVATIIVFQLIDVGFFNAVSSC